MYVVTFFIFFSNKLSTSNFRVKLLKVLELCCKSFLAKMWKALLNYYNTDKGGKLTPETWRKTVEEEAGGTDKSSHRCERKITERKIYLANTETCPTRKICMVIR